MDIQIIGHIIGQWIIHFEYFLSIIFILHLLDVK